MKNLALLIAVAFLALASPASAAETATCAPVTPAVEQQTDGPLPPLDMIRPILIPYCSSVHGTPCTSQVGTTKACTDVCRNQLSCTCTAWAGAKYWACDQEC